MQPLGQRARRHVLWLAAVAFVTVVAGIVWEARHDASVAFLSARGPADGRLDLASRHFLLASVLRRHGRPDEALSEARQGIALDPDSPGLYAIAADVLATQGDLEGAVHAWREALRLSPHSRTAHASLARLLDRLGQG